MMKTENGTRFVEPGQGSTMHELLCAADPVGAAEGYYWADSVQGTLRPRTNLALTGSPLTAEDIENIRRAK